MKFFFSANDRKQYLGIGTRSLQAFMVVLSAALIFFTPYSANCNEFRIGVLYPLSGAHQESGLELQAAVKLAAQIVNGEFNFDLPMAHTKGIVNHGGAQLKIIFADHKGDPATGQKEAERLIAEEKVVALMGCYNSAVTAKASEVAERQQVPFLSATSTSPELTERGFQWFFRSTPHDGLFAENFYQFLNDIKKRDKANIHRIAILNENTIWGSGVVDAELHYAGQYGFDVVMALQYPQNANNFESEVRMLKNAGPEVLFQASYLADALSSVRTYKRSGFKPRAVIGMNAGFLSPGFIDGLGIDAEGLLSREVWSYDLYLAKPIIKSIASFFQIRSGKILSGNSARAMTGLFVLADALNRASRLDSEGIRASLEKTDIPSQQLLMPWKGIRFDPTTHQNLLGQGIIVQIQQGKYHTVWPFELASRDFAWP